MIKECEKCDHAEMCKWIDAIGEVGRCDFASTNCVKIPDNATNGDVIKALFPNCALTCNIMGEEFICEFNGNKKKSIADREWWDEPYKSESKKEDDEDEG